MRTTLNTIYRQINTSVNNLTTDLERLNTQISSGTQMSKISDDPVNLISALRFRSSISEINQYTENITLGNTTITASENSLREMKELVVRAKELAIQAINPVLSSSEHKAIAEEVSNLNDQAVMLANTQINGKYIFGGQRTTGYSGKEPSPFVADQGSGHWLNAQASSTAIPANTLKINGVDIAASASASAADKAAAINAANSGAQATGVSASVVPASLQGGVVPGGAVAVGDFIINGTDIAAPAGFMVNASDQGNVLVDAINAQTSATGVKATRDAAGQLILTAVDGRNITIGGTAPAKAGLSAGVTYGALKLQSDREFILEDASQPAESAFAALGLKGGEAVTGEAGDVADDGKIDVVSIHKQAGAVRYNGDLENDLKIKIGKVETMVVGFSGKKAVVDSGVFTSLQGLEDALRQQNYTSALGENSASDTTVTLDSGITGLEDDTRPTFTAGSFDIVVSDHDTDPPTSKSITLDVDPSVDTLDSVVSRINGVAHISASWNGDGKLVITSDDPSRYTFNLTQDSSNFLQNAGVDAQALQNNYLNDSLTNLTSSMDKLTEKISSFGAKANRIEVQSKIYSGLQLAAQTNLSEVQDTDIVKAVMDLKGKETAYQATLAAAAKTMQLSLVDFL